MIGIKRFTTFRALRTVATCFCISFAFSTNVQAKTPAPIPKVFAAWSQLIGQTQAKSTAASEVEMRFVVENSSFANRNIANTNDNKKSLCDFFRIAAPGLKPADVLAYGETPTQRILRSKSGTPLEPPFPEVVVCRLNINSVQSQLYDQLGNPVSLYSLINRHNHELDQQGYSKPGKYWVSGPSNGKEAVVAGKKWIERNSTIKLLTLGDTGCRGGDVSRRGQNCEKWKGYGDWPFPELSQVGEQVKPDLVIHVGDYRYFHEHKLRKDSWQLWQKDFFPAAQPLLLAAPWAFARGNHEGCPNGALGFGVGYFEFFGQSDEIHCGTLSFSEPYRSPWYFDVTPKDGNLKDTHRFVIIDANNYGFGVQEDKAEMHFSTAIDISNKSGSSWWVWHSPAVQRISWKPEAFGDRKLRKALLGAAGYYSSGGEKRFCKPGNTPSCNPSMFLLGHQHLYQDVTFSSGNNWSFPMNTIVGHGGVNLRNSNPAPRKREFCGDKFPVGVNAVDVYGEVNTVVDHGFTLWSRAANSKNHGQAGWSPQYVWARDITINGNKVHGKLSGLPSQKPTEFPACVKL